MQREPRNEHLRLRRGSRLHFRRRTSFAGIIALLSFTHLSHQPAAIPVDDALPLATAT